jgi:hypothetical protein
LYEDMDSPRFAADLERAEREAKLFAETWRGKLIDQSLLSTCERFWGCYAPTKRRFWGDGGSERDGINTAFTVMSQGGAMRGVKGRLRKDNDRSHTRC